MRWTISHFAVIDAPLIHPAISLPSPYGVATSGGGWFSTGRGGRYGGLSWGNWRCRPGPSTQGCLDCIHQRISETRISFNLALGMREFPSPFFLLNLSLIIIHFIYLYGLTSSETHEYTKSMENFQFVSSHDILKITLRAWYIEGVALDKNIFCLSH